MERKFSESSRYPYNKSPNIIPNLKYGAKSLSKVS
jgi:hypothetical protein